MPARYPAWDTRPAPRTERCAAITAWRHEAGVGALRVEGASYRGSRPLSVAFELVEGRPQPDRKGRYEVYCSWFGVKPSVRYPTLKVSPGCHAIEEHYSGLVVDAISTDRAELCPVG